MPIRGDRRLPADVALLVHRLRFEDVGPALGGFQVVSDGAAAGPRSDLLPRGGTERPVELQTMQDLPALDRGVCVRRREADRHGESGRDDARDP